MQKLYLGLLSIIIGITIPCCSKTDAPTPVVPTIPPAVANFSYTGATLAPATISFTNLSTNATVYSWDFGDGGTSLTKNPTHTFTKGGTFTVKLTATGNGTTNSTTKNINIQSPTALKIKGIRIIDMSFIDPSCSCGWDNISGPDVYFTLTDNANNVLVTGNVFPDATTSSLPLVWVLSNPYQITNFGSTYKIFVYDKDAPPVDPDDFIGGYQFIFSTWANLGYPTVIPIQSSNSQLKVELTVEWL